MLPKAYEKIEPVALLEFGSIGEFAMEEAVGNSCLQGAAARLLKPDAEKEISAIRKVSEEIRLSDDKDFNELYMDYMFFEEV